MQLYNNKEFHCLTNLLPCAFADFFLWFVLNVPATKNPMVASMRTVIVNVLYRCVIQSWALSFRVKVWWAGPNIRARLIVQWAEPPSFVCHLQFIAHRSSAAKYLTACIEMCVPLVCASSFRRRPEVAPHPGALPDWSAGMQTADSAAWW